MGLTRGVNKNHIIRAALESMAYQTNDLMAAMEEDMGHPLQKFKVDGGASANNFLLEFQAGIMDMPVISAAVYRDDITWCRLSGRTGDRLLEKSR